jgi:hypothetical protein
VPSSGQRFIVRRFIYKNFDIYYWSKIMSNIQELEIAVSQLSDNELLQFSEWFEVFVADQWDKKIEADILSGRLDAAGKHADDEFLAGRASPQ